MGPERPQLRLRGSDAAPGAARHAGAMSPSLRPSRLGAVMVFAWLVTMAVAGVVLAGSQSSSRQAMMARAEARTQYAASFASIYAHDALARQRSAAESWLSTPRVSRETLGRAAAALGLRGAVLLDAHGDLIATLDRGASSLDGVLANRYRSFAASSGARRTARISLRKVGAAPEVSFAVAYSSPSGRRVFSGAYAIADTVLPTILSHVLTTAAWRADLVDANGGRLVMGRLSRSQGGLSHFSAPVAGTTWRIDVRAPDAQLYGFIYGAGRWLAWVALAGLSLAGLAILALITRLARRRGQLTALNAELARLAAVDPLTGVRNRRAIEEYLHDALSAARRHEHPLSVLVIDIDHFKNFNDTLGHRSGDTVLAHTADVLNGALRAEDAIGRWGGEEFLVVLPGTDAEGALQATDRLRAALAANQPEEARSHGLALTVTIGVAEWRQEDMSELIGRADDALYGGKAAGRDTARVSPDVVGITAIGG
jgi:diguanylate cyclase (GGDEF)-like protein